MEADDKEGKKKARVSRSLGSLAARRRAQLREFEEQRKAKEEALRQAQKALADAVKQAEARERRRATTERKHNENRLKWALGNLVLGKMRAYQGSDLRIGQDDLRMLTEKDRERLTQALSHAPQAPEESDINRRNHGLDDGPPDVEV